MNTYGIETHYNGTIIYHIGACRTIQEAYEKAKKGYRWFAVNPDINSIVITDKAAASR